MSEKITMIGALANSGIKNGNKVLSDFLAENIEGIESKQMLTGPGIKNALDWQMIINIVSFVSDIATIADVFWKAYEKFIVPKRNENKNSFIFIQINNEDGDSKRFLIGTQYKNKEIFIKTFTTEAKKIAASGDMVTIEETTTTKRIIQINDKKII